MSCYGIVLLYIYILSLITNYERVLPVASVTTTRHTNTRITSSYEISSGIHLC
jgi:hypothetical protein